MTKPYYEPIILDGKPVEKITAFLFHKGGNDDPKKLKANENKSFQGSIVLGMGFTFDDSNETATPISEMHRLIAENPKNSEVIFPYIGGSEVNFSPTHQHHRYVINFGEMSEEEARTNYPDLLQIVEEKVKPKRLKDNRNSYKKYWWQYAEKRIELQQAIAPLKRVLVTNAQASTHLSFIFYSSQVVFANSLNIFPFDNHSTFTILQSRIHEIFARFFSSSIKDDLRYNPSDCFETFPFPLTFNKSPLEPTLLLGNTVSLSNCLMSTEREKELEKSLEEIGKICYEYRAKIMIENNQGLTDTYNRFHDPEEQDPAILKLRELHDQMDRIVLDAYGWTDIQPTCEFLLDYEEEDEDENDSFILSQGNETGTNKGGKRHKKKPWHYRWNEDIHDEILARLLDLNQQRYEEEILSGETAQTKPKQTRKTTTTSKKKSNNLTLKIPGI